MTGLGGVVRPLLLTALLLASGCRQPSGLDHLLGERAGTTPPSSDGSCDFDLSDGRDETVFRVLGVLDEYLGRNIVEDDDGIESFYCNEPVLARWFGEQLGTLTREQGIAANARPEIVQECLTVFRGRAIAEKLNSCYRFRVSAERLLLAADGTHRRTATSSLGADLFLRGTPNTLPDGALGDELFHRRRALAYITGAWVRYGRESRFVFANSREKAELVGRLLSWLGARDVRVEIHIDAIPGTSVVQFSASPEIRTGVLGMERELAALSAGDPSRSDVVSSRRRWRSAPVCRSPLAVR